MMYSSFSKRGQLIFCPLITWTWTRPRRGTSRAVPAISPITHASVAVAQKEHRAGHINREIDSVAGAGFRRIHVAAECFGNHRAARLPAGRSYADAAEERMQGKLHGEFRVERMKGCGVGGVVNGVEPDFLRDGRV